MGMRYNLRVAGDELSPTALPGTLSSDASQVPFPHLFGVETPRACAELRWVKSCLYIHITSYGRALSNIS